MEIFLQSQFFLYDFSYMEIFLQSQFFLYNFSYMENFFQLWILAATSKKILSCLPLEM